MGKGASKLVLLVISYGQNDQIWPEIGQNSKCGWLGHNFLAEWTILLTGLRSFYNQFLALFTNYLVFTFDQMSFIARMASKKAVRYPSKIGIWRDFGGVVDGRRGRIGIIIQRGGRGGGGGLIPNAYDSWRRRTRRNYLG